MEAQIACGSAIERKKQPKSAKILWAVLVEIVDRREVRRYSRERSSPWRSLRFWGSSRRSPQPFYVTLVSRIMMFALAAARLNVVLGYGATVRFGQALYPNLTVRETLLATAHSR